MEATKAELASLEKMIKPIQIKYEYLREAQKDQTV